MDVLNYFVYTFYFVNIKYFQLVLAFPGSSRLVAVLPFFKKFQGIYSVSITNGLVNVTNFLLLMQFM